MSKILISKKFKTVKKGYGMKKALFFMIGVLLTVWFPSAAAAKFLVDGNWYEPINDTEVELVTYGEKRGRGPAVIPSTVEHDGRTYTVVSIGKRVVKYHPGSDTVVIPNTVRELKDSAFYRCPITTVEIPNSVGHIGKDAFCDLRMQNLLISDLSHWLRVKRDNIHSNPMCYCDYPHYNYNFPNRNHGILFVNGKRITKLVIPADIDTIGDYAFAGMYNWYAKIDTCIIGDNVKHIGKSAFLDTHFKTLILGKSLKTIESDAFKYSEVGSVYADKATWLGIDFANGYSNPVIGRFHDEGDRNEDDGHNAAKLYLDGALFAKKQSVPDTLRELKTGHLPAAETWWHLGLILLDGWGLALFGVVTSLDLSHSID